MINQELIDIFTGSKRNRIIETLEIYHAETGTYEYICKYPESIDLTLETGEVKTFTPANFVVSLPDYEQNANLNMQISFSSVGFTILKELETILRSSSEKLKINYRFYTESNFNFPQLQAPFLMTITAADIQQRNVTLQGSLLLTIQTSLPALEYTAESFPGLKYIE